MATVDEVLLNSKAGFDPYKLTFLLADDSGSEDDLDEERILFLPNQNSVQDENSVIPLDSGGLQADGTESLEMTKGDNSPDSVAPSHETRDLDIGDLLQLLPKDAELQTGQQQENQPKKQPSKTSAKGKKVQKVSAVDFYKMQMLTTEHQFRMKMMAEEYQRRMEMTRLEHEQRMKNMAEENSICLERHALEIEMIRTKKEILNKRLMCLSNNLIFDYTKSGE